VRHNVGRRIRRWRRLSALTQAELAETVGVTQATLSHYETGKRDVSVSILLRIAGALDVSVQDLTGTPPPVDRTPERN